MEPPFKPNFGNENLDKLFNIQQSQSAMKDTYITNTNKKIISDNKNAFEGFNTKWKNTKTCQ